MIITIISTLIGIIVTFIICYYLPKEKVKQANLELVKQEQELRLEIKDAEKEYNALTNKFEIEQQRQAEILREDIRKFEQEKNHKNLSFLKAEMELKENIANLEGQIEEKKKSILTLDAQSTEAVESLKQKTYDLMVQDILSYSQQEIDKCKYLNNQAQQEYEQMMVELKNQYLSSIASSEEEYSKILNQLNEAKLKTNAIIEANKRIELDKAQKDFYKLQLSDLDIEEIKKIRSIEPYLRNKEPLNKVIWKVYYEKPYQDLVGRVVGAKRKCGVYKITHIASGKCYIGQSNDIAERWRQHIKRGIGADQPTQNKLYPAMLENGAENFTFEIIEECLPNQLTEREKYYTDIFQANTYGYVARKG